MKTYILSICLVVLFYFGFNAQEYSRVKVFGNQEELTRLSQLGVTLDHGIRKEGMFFISDFSKYEIQTMEKYGYDYDSATKSGLRPDESGHWGSIDPNTGKILKGPKHPSIMKTKKIERVLGNKIIKRNGERYSVPKKK